MFLYQNQWVYFKRKATILREAIHNLTILLNNFIILSLSNSLIKVMMSLMKDKINRFIGGMTMKGLNFLGNSKLEMMDLPDPEVGEGDVLVRVKASAICGSEMETFIPPAGLAWKGNPGHEVMGEVEDPNGSKRFRKGDRVGVATIQGCGNCYWCRQGKQDFCKEAYVLKNAHSEYVVGKEIWMQPVPNDIDNATAVMLSGDGMGVPFGASVRSGVAPGHKTCVFGVGPVGQGMAMIQTFLGARVIAIDINPKALENATEMGAWKTINPKETKDLKTAILDLTDGLGPQRIFRCWYRRPGVVQHSYGGHNARRHPYDSSTWRTWDR